MSHTVMPCQQQVNELQGALDEAAAVLVSIEELARRSQTARRINGSEFFLMDRLALERLLGIPPEGKIR